MELRIDLDDYRSGGSKVFAGRDRGRRARDKAGLDDADAKGVAVIVHIPEEVYSVNSSFFLGMFGPSIRTLGEDEFRRRYVYTGKDIQSVIDDGIREALRVQSLL